MLKTVLSSPLFAIALCLLSFSIGVFVQKKTKLAICNPLLIGIVVCIAAISFLKIPLDDFSNGSSMLTLLLQPATAVLAVNICNQIAVLKKYAIPVIVGCTVGSITSVSVVTLLCKAMGLDNSISAALFPKSVTTPIAMEIAQSHGGIVSIAIVAVIITGIMGAICAPLFAKLFKVKDPVAEGIAIGACSHALGTTKALEIGEIQGAMSGVAIGICGLITVVLSIL